MSFSNFPDEKFKLICNIYPELESDIHDSMGKLCEQIFGKLDNCNAPEDVIAFITNLLFAELSAKCIIIIKNNTYSFFEDEEKCKEYINKLLQRCYNNVVNTLRKNYCKGDENETH